MPSERPGPELLIAGPTASGKSAVALEIAERVSGEILSVDSMQVYRGLDIGTAKPTSAERARVPHHLIDVADLTESFDAARFVALAEEAVRDIESRGKAPIFCGGTGLYFKAYLEGIGGGPPGDPQMRAALEQAPFDELLRELEERDPVLFATIDRQNPRRVIRALEVMRLTGRPFSELRIAWQAGDAPVSMGGERPFFALRRQPDDLRRRIDARVDQMFAQGIVTETRSLLARGLAENRTAMQAIGYRQVVEHLRGVHSLEETISLVKLRTRQYAKRQMTWFRRQARLTWVDVGESEPAESIAEKIVAQIRNERS